MVKYRIFKGRVEIGLLEINEKGYHRYTPIEKQFEAANIGMASYF